MESNNIGGFYETIRGPGLLAGSFSASATNLYTASCIELFNALDLKEEVQLMNCGTRTCSAEGMEGKIKIGRGYSATGPSMISTTESDCSFEGETTFVHSKDSSRLSIRMNAKDGEHLWAKLNAKIEDSSEGNLTAQSKKVGNFEFQRFNIKGTDASYFVQFSN